MRRLVRMLGPYRHLVACMVAMGTVGAGLNLLGPLLLGRATDVIFAGVVGQGLPAGASQAEVVTRLRAEGHDTLANVVTTVDLVPGQGIDFGRLGGVLAIALGLFVVASLFVLGQERLAATIVRRVVFDLRERVAAKLARLPLGFFDRHPTGDLLSRVTNDVDNLQQVLQQTLSQLLTSVLSIVGVLVLMFAISPLLAVVVLVGVPVAGAVAARTTRRAQPAFARRWDATGALTAHVDEVYTGHSLVRGFDRGEQVERAFDEHNAEVFAAGSRAEYLAGTMEPSMVFVAGLNYIAVVVVGALRVASGSMSIGDVQAFIQYSAQFGRPVALVAEIAGLLQSGLASARRVFEVLDAPEQEPDPVRPARPARVRGRVEFDHVSFRYDADTPVLQDIRLTVEPGRTVAIVGPTGAGKTTLGNLLMRFHEVDDGRILVDGTDIATMTRDELRAGIGPVPQDAWLFHGTIAENIAYGRAGATRDEIVAAARATQVDHFVRTLPDGYDTVLDDRETGLSAGERQLVTVARAFLADPAILVLDEATSSVDTRTEALVRRAMNSLRAGRTSLVIAHRLSTVRDADLIVHLENGRITEAGTHTALLAAGGAYARLHGARFGADTTDPADTDPTDSADPDRVPGLVT
ncbi:ABC transporter transmembrane domain-containing protein [Actinokineospora enzanensis]|uniref:ABC transporter transmembrane domain-containing protein n=1 Tax=Actinokineospora enzanensis TaxID=155975 RepID=UPI0003751764